MNSLDWVCMRTRVLGPVFLPYIKLGSLVLFFKFTLVGLDGMRGPITSGKWEISDQKNDQNPHINDHFWFGDRWWLICGLLLRDQNWSFLFWSFIACQLVINLVIYLVINLVNIWINDQIYYHIYDHVTN